MRLTALEVRVNTRANDFGLHMISIGDDLARAGQYPAREGIAWRVIAFDERKGQCQAPECRHGTGSQALGISSRFGTQFSKTGSVRERRATQQLVFRIRPDCGGFLPASKTMMSPRWSSVWTRIKCGHRLRTASLRGTFNAPGGVRLIDQMDRVAR